jgi:hypothetical protein
MSIGRYKRMLGKLQIFSFLSARGRAMPRTLLAILLMVGLGCVLFVGAVEIFYRFKAPYRGFGGARELPQFRRGGPAVAATFVVDPDFGFRPVFDNGQHTAFGTLANDYPLTKSNGKKRLLFIGDSVTRRGHIVDALKDEYGSLKYEYWNAGVESFNTVQEVRYYKYFNRALRPDEVLLTFHLNDFETTPVAFREADGSLVVYAPNVPAQRINPWLFQHSYLYRSWIGVTTARKTERGAIIKQVRASLDELKRMVDADGARLTVLVLPILRPQNDWSAEYRENRRHILDILESLQLRYFDLLEPLNQAFADGVSTVEAGDDLFWHPSREVAKYFGAYLRRKGLLETTDGL